MTVEVNEEVKNGRPSPKRDAVMGIFATPGGLDRSNVEIAAEVGCYDGFVSHLRAEWKRDHSADDGAAARSDGPAPVSVAMDSIEVDFAFQLRVGMVPEKIEEYAEFFRDGESPPPVDLVPLGDDGGGYLLAHGFHRHRAAEVFGADSIAGLIHDPGDDPRRAALLIALAANARNPMPRTAADKRKAVLTALADEEFGASSERELARICRVSRNLVAAVRRELEEMDDIDEGGPEPEAAPARDSGPSATVPRQDDGDPGESAQEPVEVAVAEAGDVPGMTAGAIEKFLDATIYPKLSGSPAVRFRNDAVAYLTFTRIGEFAGLHREARRIFSPGRGVRLVGPYNGFMARWVSYPHPRHWMTCGACGGSGQSGDSECRACRGYGYSALTGGTK